MASRICSVTNCVWSSAKPCSSPDTSAVLDPAQVSSDSRSWAKITRKPPLGTQDQARVVGRYFWYKADKLLGLGFAPPRPSREALVDTLAWLLDSPEIPERLARVMPKIEARGKFTLRTLDMKNFKRDVDAFLDAFRAGGGFERLGDEFLPEEKAYFKRENIPFYF